MSPFFSFLAVMEPDVDAMDDETEYDFIKEVPKPISRSILVKIILTSFTVEKLSMCFITGLSLRFHAITVKFSSKYCKNTSHLPFYNMLCSLDSYASRHFARVLRKRKLLGV